MKTMTFSRLTFMLGIGATLLFSPQPCHALFSDALNEEAYSGAGPSRPTYLLGRENDPWIDALVKNQGGAQRFLEAYPSKLSQSASTRVCILDSLATVLTNSQKIFPLLPYWDAGVPQTPENVKYVPNPLPPEPQPRQYLEAMLDTDDIQMAEVALNFYPQLLHHPKPERRAAYVAAKEALEQDNYVQALSILMDPDRPVYMGYPESVFYTRYKVIHGLAQEILEFVYHRNTLELSRLFSADVLGRPDLIRPLVDSLDRTEIMDPSDPRHHNRRILKTEPYHRGLSQILTAFGIHYEPRGVAVLIPDESAPEAGELRPPHPAGESIMGDGWDAESKHIDIEDLDLPVAPTEPEHPLTRLVRETKEKTLVEKQARQFNGTLKDMDDLLKQDLIAEWVQSIEPTHLMRWSDSGRTWVPAEWSHRRQKIVLEKEPKTPELLQEWRENAAHIWATDLPVVWSDPPEPHAQPTASSRYMWDTGFETDVARDFMQIEKGLRTTTDLYYISETGEKVFFRRRPEPNIATYVPDLGPGFSLVPNYYYLSRDDGLAHLKQHREATLDVYTVQLPDGTWSSEFYFIREDLPGPNGGYVMHQMYL